MSVRYMTLVHNLTTREVQGLSANPNTKESCNRCGLYEPWNGRKACVICLVYQALTNIEKYSQVQQTKSDLRAERKKVANGI